MIKKPKSKWSDVKALIIMLALLVVTLIVLLSSMGCNSHDQTGPDDDCTRGAFPDPRSGLVSDYQKTYRTSELWQQGEHQKVTFNWWWYPAYASYSENPWLIITYDSWDECSQWTEVYREDKWRE